MKTSFKQLIPALLVILLDMLGYGIVIPVLSDFLFDEKAGFLQPGQSPDANAVIYGFLAGIYPLMQFFGAPILGTLSDKYGRKKLLILSLIGTVVGYVISGFGLITHNLFLIFLGRAIDGFTGGNISIAFSCIADLSDKESKPKNFGYAAAAFGVGLILGPFFGGLTSNSDILSIFNIYTPFWIASGLTLLCVIYIYFGLKETLHTSIHSKISFLTGIKNLHSAFRNVKLRLIFLVIFLLSIGFTTFVNFMPILLKQNFGFSKTNVGNMFAFAGICTAISLVVVNNLLIKFFKPKQILLFSIIFLSISFLLVLIPSKIIFIYPVVALISLFRGLDQPNSTTIVSNLSSEETQGEILGINQSIQSIAQSIPTILAGFMIAKYNNPEIPILIASGSALCAWFVFLIFLKQNKK